MSKKLYLIEEDLYKIMVGSSELAAIKEILSKSGVRVLKEEVIISKTETSEPTDIILVINGDVDSIDRAFGHGNWSITRLNEEHS